MQRLSLFLALTVSFCFAALAAGQVAPGTPNWSAYDSGAYDTINLQNLNVSLNVPVMSKSGAFPFQFAFSGANSYVYAVGGNLYAGILAVPLVAAANGSLGDTIVGAGAGTFAAPTTTTFGVMCPAGDGTGTATKYSGWYIQMADGTVHKMVAADISYSGASCSGSFTDQPRDGSGLTLSVTGNTVNSIYGRGGELISSTSLKDSNLNSITYTATGGGTWTDSLGFTELKLLSGGYTWTDVNGGSPAASVTTNTNETVRSAFGCTLEADYNSGTQTLPTSINFPDSTSLGLAWEATPGFAGDTTGRLSTLTLRDGSSTVSFNYNPAGLGSSGHYGFDCSRIQPEGLSRTTSDGTVTYTTAFSLISGSSYKELTTKIDMGGNKTVYTFTGFTSTGNDTTHAQVLTEVQYYPNTGTVGSPTYGTPLVKIYCYNSASPTVANCPTNSVSLPITEVDVFTQMSGMSNYARQQTQYDGGPSGSLPHYGNVTYSAQYDFGGSTPVRATTIIYAVNGSGNCSTIGAHVNNKPCSIVTTENDGTLVTVQSEKFTYSASGNVLTHSISPDGGTTFLVNATSNVYNSNGTISKSYDLANNETDFTYPSSYSDGTCTNFPFPSQVKNVTSGLTVNYTWDCTGGVMLTKVDANSNTTTYGYKSSGGAADPWWRLRSVNDPLNNKTWLTPTATSYESSLEFNSSNSIQNVTTTFDGYGRPINVQRQQGVGSSNYDTVSTVYNFSGVEETIYHSVPCTKTAGNSCGSTTGFTTFVDMLGRVAAKEDSGGAALEYTYAGYGATVSQNDVLTELQPAPSGETTKKVQDEYDGLGRLTKSCKISSTVSGKVTCGENSGSSSGILTTTTYSTPAAGSRTVTSSRGPSNQQQRKITVDGLGRATSKVTPEGGTWTYKYDSNTSCPSLYQGTKGMLASVSDSNGNLLCYRYDALNRVTGVNANGTTCRHFYFDSTYGTVPTGVTTPTYTQGRLAEASTDNCSGTLITDEWFSYDKDGNVLDQWESTPNSTQYYHSSATFTGPALLTMDLASPSEYTLTYTLDGEGRANSLKEGTNFVVKATGVTFNAQGQPTEIDLGASTDKDTYTYDANTGRMKTWDFKVNSVDETATLTWNDNWTLNELAITDGFNAGGSQTCDFNPTTVTGTGYDDLGRLVGSSCGTSGATWNQADSYDQFDNLKKTSTGFVSWDPMIPSTTTTNHYGCTGCTYDSNGNVTNDGTDAYTWNEFSKMKSAANTVLVYDAFGRIVEIQPPHGVSKTEVWYTQLGKTAYMAGTTYNYAYAPAPGGGTMMNQSSTNYYFHKDWLGNARIVSTVPGSGAGSVTTDRAFAPYGEIYDIFGSTNQNYAMFTGNTQDVLAGMYDAPYRELQGSQQGRWLSPDPAGYGWNQYAYPTNPNSSIDPTGLACYPLYEATCNGAGLSGNNTSQGNAETVAGYGAGWTPYGVYEFEIALGTVGADGEQYTGSYEPPGWKGGQQVQTYTPGTGPDGPPMLNLPSWFYAPTSIPVWGPCPGCLPGCAGAGIPCRLNRIATGNLAGVLAGYQGSTFTYQVVDVNDQPVQGLSQVNEYFVDGVGWLPDQGQWESGTGLADVQPNGMFVDGVGMTPGFAPYGATQYFSATVGVTSYVISTMNSLSVTTGFGGMVFATRTPF